MTRLFVTVGTNPLPVYAAAEYIRERILRGCSVTFICSEQTRAEVKRLQEALGTTGDCVPVHPYDIRECETDLEKGLPRQLEDAHLHYTGGTKCMGVEAARVLRRRTRLAMSYLDGARQRLHLDQGDVDDLRCHVSLPLAKLCRLHGESVPEVRPGVPDREDSLWSSLFSQRVFSNLECAFDDEFTYLVYGYQLLTVADRRKAPSAGEAKNGGFDGFLRTRWLGGDEARVLLLSSLPFEKDGHPTDQDLREIFFQQRDSESAINPTPVFVRSSADAPDLGEMWGGLFRSLRWFPH